MKELYLLKIEVWVYDKIIICEGNGGIRDDYMYQCQEFIIGDLYPEGQVPHKSSDLPPD